jgi:hypothetical protein
MFLRYLMIEGKCPAGLNHALPALAGWSRQGVPRCLPAADVETLIAVCDPADKVGMRDRATMIDLYEPGMSEKGIHVRLCSVGRAGFDADAGLIHRMMANLFDNELKHLSPSCSVTISLRAYDDAASVTIEDNGPGFDRTSRPEELFQIVTNRDTYPTYRAKHAIRAIRPIAESASCVFSTQLKSSTPPPPPTQNQWVAVCGVHSRLA